MLYWHLSWLGARSYVVMLSEFRRIVCFAGNRSSVELWFVVGLATLCSDAGKVNEELRLGVSGCTSLDDVGLCWFPSSLDDFGPGGATTGSVITELGVVWIYSSWLELELQLCEALNSSEFMLGPCREAACFNIRIWSWRYFVYIELGELFSSTSWSLYWKRYECHWEISSQCNYSSVHLASYNCVIMYRM